MAAIQENSMNTATHNPNSIAAPGQQMMSLAAQAEALRGLAVGDKIRVVAKPKDMEPMTLDGTVTATSEGNTTTAAERRVTVDFAELGQFDLPRVEPDLAFMEIAKANSMLAALLARAKHHAQREHSNSATTPPGATTPPAPPPASSALPAPTPAPTTSSPTTTSQEEEARNRMAESTNTIPDTIGGHRSENPSPAPLPQTAPPSAPTGNEGAATVPTAPPTPPAPTPARIIEHVKVNFTFDNIRKIRNTGKLCRYHKTNVKCPFMSRFGDCPFSHCSLTEQIKVPDTICTFFTESYCLRDPCRYFHGSIPQFHQLKKSEKKTYCPADYMATSTAEDEIIPAGPPAAPPKAQHGPPPKYGASFQTQVNAHGAPPPGSVPPNYTPVWPPPSPSLAAKSAAEYTPEELRAIRNTGKICRYFVAGQQCPFATVNRKGECPFSHITHQTRHKLPQYVCSFFISSACARDPCPFFHGSEAQLRDLKAQGTTYFPAAFMTVSTAADEVPANGCAPPSALRESFVGGPPNAFGGPPFGMHGYAPSGPHPAPGGYMMPQPYPMPPPPGAAPAPDAQGAPAPFVQVVFPDEYAQQ